MLNTNVHNSKIRKKLNMCSVLFRKAARRKPVFFKNNMAGQVIFVQMQTCLWTNHKTAVTKSITHSVVIGENQTWHINTNTWYELSSMAVEGWWVRVVLHWQDLDALLSLSPPRTPTAKAPFPRIITLFSFRLLVLSYVLLYCSYNHSILNITIIYSVKRRRLRWRLKNKITVRCEIKSVQKINKMLKAVNSIVSLSIFFLNSTSFVLSTLIRKTQHDLVLFQLLNPIQCFNNGIEQYGFIQQILWLALAGCDQLLLTPVLFLLCHVQTCAKKRFSQRELLFLKHE